MILFLRMTKRDVWSRAVGADMAGLQQADRIIVMQRPDADARRSRDLPNRAHSPSPHRGTALSGMTQREGQALLRALGVRTLIFDCDLDLGRLDARERGNFFAARPDQRMHLLRARRRIGMR